MKFTTSLAALCLTIAPALAIRVSYDPAYDNAKQSLATVACSDGSNGLLTKGYSTFDSLPHFANIGGASVIAGWNSASCGTCWTLRYNNTSINIIAIDHTDVGFNLATSALNKLTNGRAVEVGVVDATATQVAKSVCGL